MEFALVALPDGAANSQQLTEAQAGEIVAVAA